jgi:hypothetical protein
MPAPETMEGSIRIAGADPLPMVMLRPAAGGPEVQLTGDLARELMRLSGVTVSVTGTMGTGMQGLNVTEYDVTSVQGRRPTVGVIVSRDGGLWLEGDTTVRLTNPPEALQTQIGAKVWILGRTTDDGLQTESYGIIRPAQS